MKQLKYIIKEKLKIGSKSKINQYDFSPKSKSELKKIIKDINYKEFLDYKNNDKFKKFLKDKFIKFKEDNKKKIQRYK